MKPNHAQKKTIIIATLIGMIGITGLVGLIGGCQNKAADANANGAPPPPAVTVSLPTAKDVVHYAEFSGTTKAVESVTIRARVEGYLEDIHFTEGAMVSKGDRLFTIDARPYQARLDEALAALAVRQAELRQAQATATRKENAQRDGAVSEVEVIDARAQLGRAEANVTAARAAVRSAELSLAYTQVEAPISGRIGRSLVDVGNLVGAEERTQLTSIVKSDPVYAYFTISERDWIRYQAGKPHGQTADDDNGRTIYMGLSGSKDFPYEGRLDFIDNHVDAATGTIEVRGVFPNPGNKILPGLFARIRIPVGKTAGALLVPDSAIGRDQQGRFVLVANKENLTEYRPVKAGELLDGMRVIKSGLTGDERIIVNGLQRAYPGSPVTPTAEKSEGAAEKLDHTDTADSKPSV